MIQELEATAPKIPRAQPTSLAEYITDGVFVLKLSNKEGHLQATPSPQDPTVTEHCLPRVRISSEPTVSEAISQGVLCIPASQLSVVLTDGVEPKYESVPTTVKAEGTGDQFHFKHVSARWSFMRELNILIRFRRSQVPNTLRVSRLAGLVVSEDRLSVIGFLVEYIPNSKPLTSAAIGASRVNRVKWIQQVRETVTELHSADIVWGDVQPDNVLIDANGNAWIINFSGEYSGWVDKELFDTKKGRSAEPSGLGGVSRCGWELTAIGETISPGHEAE